MDNIQEIAQELIRVQTMLQVNTKSIERFNEELFHKENGGLRSEVFDLKKELLATRKRLDESDLLVERKAKEGRSIRNAIVITVVGGLASSILITGVNAFFSYQVQSFANTIQQRALSQPTTQP